MKTLLVAFLLLALGACATVPPPVSPARAYLYQPRAVASRSISSVDTDFYTTLAGCQAVLTGFEQQSIQAKQWSVGMQLAGAIAGSIFAPIAIINGWSQAWTAGLAGFAGFTNTAVSVVRNEALDAASILMSRASVLNGMQRGLEDYYAARATQPIDLGKLQVAVDRLRVSCLAYDLASPNPIPIVAQ